MNEHEYVSMSAESLSCNACGASISFGGGSAATCAFCSTENRLLQPLKLHRSATLGLDTARQESYDNMVKICETSMAAGSYEEAYNYCNKLLELDPENGELYANKAICSFHNSTVGNIYDGCRDISTFIRTALRFSPDSEIVKETAINLAYDLYYSSAYHAREYQDTYLSGVHGAPALQGLLPYIQVWDTAFEIYNDTGFLKNAVIVLSGHKITDPVNLEGNSWKRMVKKSTISREIYIKKIQALEPDYRPPSMGVCFIATATMGDYDHPLVLELRLFRDDYLLQRNWGHTFVDFYYKWGSYPASIIETNNVLKKLSCVTIVRPLAYLASKLNNR